MIIENRASLVKDLVSFLDQIEHHPIYKNDYFQHLCKQKWVPESYELYRANFFYRTELTVKGIAHVCARSAAVNDMDTLTLFSYILSEETGMGDKTKCHEIFMESALNVFGEKEFGTPPMAAQSARNSDLIIPETLRYRERIQSLINESYPRMLGVAMALESHADRMLTAFRKAFRLNQKNMAQHEFVNQVEVYFNAHIENGVEERHAEDSRQCVINNCSSAEDLNEIMFGVNETLQVQQEMWDAMFAHTLKLEAKSLVNQEYSQCVI